jgi:hypothetical protein
MKHCTCERPTGRSAAGFAEEIEGRVNEAKKALFFLMTITDGNDLDDAQKIGALFDIVRALSGLECTAEDLRDCGVTSDPSPAESTSRSNGHAATEAHQ